LEAWTIHNEKMMQQLQHSVDESSAGPVLDDGNQDILINVTALDKYKSGIGRQHDQNKNKNNAKMPEED